MTGFALFFASTTCATLLASHLSAASFIAWKDLSGAWATHNLKRTTNGLRTYTQHLPSLLFDVLVLLLPCMYVFGLHREGQLTAPLFDFGATWTENAVLLGTALLKAVACNVLNRTWAMLIHWLFHVFPPLYKLIHKRHHCALKEMCATSGWQDTCLEFLGMEVLGVFLLAPTLLPVLCAPWQMHVLLAAYNGAAGAIDHSGFYVPGTIIDGRYHMVHHRDLYYNYAEMETLDWLFGTLRHHEVQDAALPTARESQKVDTVAASIPAEPSPLVLQDGACQAIHELRRSSVGHATPGPTLWRTVRSATRGS